MNEEPDTNPEQITNQPKPFNSVTYWFSGIFIFFVVAYLLALFIHSILTAKKNPERTEAISNAKQIGLALFDFEDQYGSFPSKDTLALIEEEHPNHGLDLSGDSSNALLRQLYVETGSSPEMLKKGKFHYAYISNLTSAGNPSKPILFGPVIPGTNKIDPKAFSRKAVVLRADNSASVLNINKEGHIIDKDDDILSTEHPFWNGTPPTIHYPE